MPKSAYEWRRAQECLSEVAATEPMPACIASPRLNSSEDLGSRVDSPTKGYMRPTTSYLAKRRAKKLQTGKSRIVKGTHLSRSSMDSSKQGKKSESLSSVTETMDSGWELSARRACTPLSNKIVEEWLDECDLNKENIRETKQICLARCRVGDGWVVVGSGDSCMDYSEQRVPEVPYVDDSKKHKKGRRFLGHVCSFLLGVGTITLLGVLN